MGEILEGRLMCNAFLLNTFRMLLGNLQLRDPLFNLDDPRACGRSFS